LPVYREEKGNQVKRISICSKDQFKGPTFEVKYRLIISVGRYIGRFLIQTTELLSLYKTLAFRRGQAVRDTMLKGLPTTILPKRYMCVI